MLRFLDLVLTLEHLLIIGFNLFGWIFPRARKFHLAFIILTALCWFVLGIWYGIGYCPVTDWQWRIKEQLGEHNLPPSFITYFAEKIFQTEFSDALVNTLTLVLFLAAAVVSIYLNFFRKVNV